jgi:hypothetical protein
MRSHDSAQLAHTSAQCSISSFPEMAAHASAQPRQTAAQAPQVIVW